MSDARALRLALVVVASAAASLVSALSAASIEPSWRREVNQRRSNGKLIRRERTRDRGALVSEKLDEFRALEIGHQGHAVKAEPLQQSHKADIATVDATKMPRSAEAPGLRSKSSFDLDASPAGVADNAGGQVAKSARPRDGADGPDADETRPRRPAADGDEDDDDDDDKRLDGRHDEKRHDGDDKGHDDKRPDADDKRHEGKDDDDGDDDDDDDDDDDARKGKGAPNRTRRTDGDEAEPAPVGDVDDDGDVPAPSPGPEDKATNSSDFINSSFPSPTPSPTPVPLTDFLGPPGWSPSPYPPAPLDDSLCKDATDIKVRDVRDKPIWAGVSAKRHGGGKACTNSTMLLGSFPNGRLEACAGAVAGNNSCGNEFQMHKVNYTCACVVSWSICRTESEPDTCLYELNPGAFGEDDDDDADDDAGHAAHGD